MIAIRTARASDAEAIARCHAAAWRDTYRPILADAYLATLTFGEHVAKWNQLLHDLRSRTFVAEGEGEGMVGFIRGGRERNRRSEYRGEIYAIYLRKEFRRRGIGRKLFQRFAKALLDDQITSLIVWAFDGNDFRSAYASWGGREIERGPIRVGQQTLTEVAYGWRDIAALGSFPPATMNEA